MNRHIGNHSPDSRNPSEHGKCSVNCLLIFVVFATFTFISLGKTSDLLSDIWNTASLVGISVEKAQYFSVLLAYVGFHLFEDVEHLIHAVEPIFDQVNQAIAALLLLCSRYIEYRSHNMETLYF